MTIKHPAKFSDAILEKIAKYMPQSGLVLDPFAGVGRLKEILTPATIILSELEYDWAKEGSCSIVGDALALPLESNSIGAIITSPCYGNRMADHHNARDGSRRITYRHVLGKPLHPHNAGQLQWGETYRDFHRRAWRECDRVLRSGGLFILNVSDHIRDGAVVPVSNWHLKTLVDMGYVFVKAHSIQTPRMKRGANYDLRVDYENLFVLRKA